MHELSRLAKLLEAFERIQYASVKVALGNVLQLRLGIVDVIHIHAINLHVSERLLELVLQVSGRHAVTAADNIVERSDARPYERLFDILTHVARRLSVEGQITTLRADQQL